MLQQLMQKLDWIAAVGFVAQVLFFGRFMVQWIASERSGRSVVPVSFWYFSIVGSVGLLFYSIMRADPVFILGQSLGMVIYVRNLMLIYRERSAPGAAGGSEASS